MATAASRQLNPGRWAGWPRMWLREAGQVVVAAHASSIGCFGPAAHASCDCRMPRRSVPSILRQLPRLAAACLVTRHPQSCGSCLVCQPYASSLGRFNRGADASSGGRMPRVTTFIAWSLGRLSRAAHAWSQRLWTVSGRQPAQQAHSADAATRRARSGLF